MARLPFEDPEYSHGKYDRWLMPWIRKRIAHNMDVLGLFVGPRGSGKSYGALELSYMCDSTFNSKRVMFDVGDFVDFVIDGGLKRGNAAILDDAGVFMNARDWQTVQNKAISVVAQSFRYRNLITFITVPKWSYIDKQTRGLINIFFESTGEQGVFKIKIPKPNPYHRDEDNLVYPTFQFPNRSGMSMTAYDKTIKFDLPPSWLSEEYEEKRNIEITKKQREVQQALHDLKNKEGGNSTPRKPKKVNKKSLQNLKHYKG